MTTITVARDMDAFSIEPDEDGLYRVSDTIVAEGGLTAVEALRTFADFIETFLPIDVYAFDEDEQDAMRALDARLRAAMTEARADADLLDE